MSRKHARCHGVVTGTTIVMTVLVTIACGGKLPEPSGDSAGTSLTLPPAGAPEMTAGSTGAIPGTLAAGTTANMVARGDSIFHGLLAGGTCFTCHGADAKGTPLAPPLVRHAWRTGDGSLAFLEKRVAEGVPNPKPPYAATMPPMGGSQLSPEQIKAVASYVFAISH